jgi:hypothetical protein
MAVTFANTTGLLHTSQTVNVTALSATTAYVATITGPAGHTRRIEFTTDGAGAATLTFEPQSRGAYSISVSAKTPAAAATGSNTFTGV